MMHDLRHCGPVGRRALLAGGVAALATPAWAQCPDFLPPGAVCGDTRFAFVEAEHDARKRLIARARQQGLLGSRAQLFDITVPAEAHGIPGVQHPLPLLRVVFPTVSFYTTGGMEPTRAGGQAIVLMADTLASSPPDAALFVVGHADSRGAADMNRSLAYARAGAAARRVSRRAPNAQVFEVSAGEDVPIASNTTADGRARNRRLEFLFAPHPNVALAWLARHAPDTCGTESVGLAECTALSLPARRVTPQDSQPDPGTPGTDLRSADTPVEADADTAHPDLPLGEPRRGLRIIDVTPQTPEAYTFAPSESFIIQRRGQAPRVTESREF